MTAAARAPIAPLLLIGAAGGTLSGLFGIGGGTVIVPALVLWLGMSQQRAAGTSVAAILPTAVVGAVSYGVQGNIDWVAALCLAVGIVAGAQLGSYWLARLSTRALQWGFMAFLLIVIVSLWFVVPQRGDQIQLTALTVSMLVLTGVITGILSGLLGVGGGVVVVPGLMFFFGADDLVAKGSSLVMMIPGSISGTLGNLRRQNVDLRAAAIVGVTSSAFVPFSSLLAGWLDPLLGNILFSVYLAIILLQMLLRALRRRGRRAGAPARCQTGGMHERAAMPARPDDLVDLDALLDAFTATIPDVGDPAQRVVFGTSGHRGTSFTGAFTESHIVAISAAIAEHRAAAGIRGPLFLGADTHALSGPAERVAREVLSAAGVRVLYSSGTGDAAVVPTPALSHAILSHNRGLAADDPQRADGIVVTPSHNPPGDGGFKYNPPHGGPADSETTAWIAHRANELLQAGVAGIPRAGRAGEPGASGEPGAPGAPDGGFDFLGRYVDALGEAIDLDAIRDAGVRLGAHPLGGASTAYWAAIRDRHRLDITVLGPGIDPQWSFMHLDWDGKIRMDPSSPQVMATVAGSREDFPIVVANDADADRHGIVTADAGLMNPNHFLAVAIDYLLTHRPGWPTEAGIGKTLVSSAMIDRVVAAHGRRLVEVPVGFKWFVPGLLDGSLAFGGEESAGASFQRFDGTAWSTDKDGILLALLAAEILAVTGRTPSERYHELAARFGEPAYARVDAPATSVQKARLASLSAADVTDTELAGDPITAVLTAAPDGGAPIGGVKVQTAEAWFAARPSGTEDVMKIYAESFRGPEHLLQVQAAARALVDRVLAG